uniref:Putative RNA binding protein n=1 Tax=Siphoviridae sp. ctgN495 TaxID=2825608 RepID=A0A8S5UCD2_9CAUD|nr:MAG TPA: putative RNA binding protein [Siphoviridae sp. ctgN495]
MGLEIGKFVDVEVIRIIDKGAVVRLEDGHTELIHLSKVSNKFVRDVNDYLAVGDRLKAEVVKGTYKETELSIKYLDLSPKKKEVNQKPIENSNLKKSYNQTKKESFPQMSLDDMIKNSNKQFDDKFRGKREFTKKNKNHRKNKRPYEDD